MRTHGNMHPHLPDGLPHPMRSPRANIDLLFSYIRHTLTFIGCACAHVITSHMDSSIYQAALEALIARGENRSYYEKLLSTCKTRNTLGV